MVMPCIKPPVSMQLALAVTAGADGAGCWHLLVQLLDCSNRCRCAVHWHCLCQPALMSGPVRHRVQQKLKRRITRQQ
jgi:hypothetical protein